MTTRLVLTAIALAAATLPASRAGATALTAKDILQQFNLVTVGNMTTGAGGDLTTSADIEGRAVVLGNVNNGATIGAATRNNAAASSYGQLSVLGNVSGGTLNIGSASKGAIDIRGNNTAAIAVSSASSEVDVFGTNSGNINGAGAAIYLGSNTSGGTINGNGGAIDVNGANAGSLQNTSGNIYAGSNSGTINANSGKAYVNGNNTGSVSSNSNTYVKGTDNHVGNRNGGTANTNTSFSPASIALAATDFTTPLSQLQTTLNALTSGHSYTGTVSDPNNVTLSAGTPNASGIAVIDTTTAYLAQARTLNVALNSATTLIINVTGTSFTQAFNFNTTTYQNQHILWNFENATTATFGNFGGTVIALSAATSISNGAFNGDLIARSFSGGGELHDFTFAGELPTISGTQAAQVPEAGSLMLVAGGLGVYALLSRRRSAARAA